MAGKTYAERLAEVQTAIESILIGGQGYGILGRNLNRADLRLLYEQEKYYQAMADREANSRGRLRVRGGVPR